MEVAASMADAGIGDYFISDVEDVGDDDDELLTAPVVVPAAVPAPQQARPAQAPAPAYAPAPTAPQPAPAAQSASARVQAARPQASTRPASREEQLVAALDYLMEHSPDIQAAALVSLDGFTMASALPSGMQEDRVGAMSAAILGLGERAAAELGRGHLSQVFIEGQDGYVLLMAAGDRAVLTALADPSAKLGLVLYDMREAADGIGEILR
jgi:predicted regulator of Ras-like GTPase activity (Roadblock/LC7/MglB family)